MASVRHYERFDRRIGIVCDRILYDSIESAADFVYIAYGDEWRDSIADIDCMLVVSTWRGLRNDDWRGIANEGTPQRHRILEIIDGCRERGIPVVFYSKEDPPNYWVFIEIARRCDFVFTSAEEMVPRYMADCGHARVSVLKFCVDPGIQNPIGCMDADRKSGAIFSGSWMIKYPDRCSALQMLLDGAATAKMGMCIFDRNSKRDSVSLRFPSVYEPYLRPSVEHEALCGLHKAREWSINVNSVTSSATMFAGRCYELLASGCLVLSNYSYGMSRCLPAVAVAHSTEDVCRSICCSDVGLLQLRRLMGVRAVMNGNTCYDRIGAVLAAAGFRDSQPRRKVAVVAGSVDSRVRRMFDEQTYSDKALFVESALDESTFGSFDYVARWDASRDYGRHYLEDMVNAFKFGEFDFAVEGKKDYVCTDVCCMQGNVVIWRRSFTHCDFISGKTILGLKGLAVPNERAIALPVGVKPAIEKVAAVEVCVGSDSDGAMLRAIPSLRKSRFFDKLVIILRNVAQGDLLAVDAAEKVCRMYPGIICTDGDLRELPHLKMEVSDEALYPGFDDMIASASAARRVSGGVLFCGRERRLVKNGVAMLNRLKRGAVCIDMPVLARYGDVKNEEGILWIDAPYKKAPLWKRAYGCYQDNGLLYTIKRIFFGKKSAYA